MQAAAEECRGGQNSLKISLAFTGTDIKVSKSLSRNAVLDKSLTRIAEAVARKAPKMPTVTFVHPKKVLADAYE